MFQEDQRALVFCRSTSQAKRKAETFVDYKICTKRALSFSIFVCFGSNRNDSIVFFQTLIKSI